MLPTRLAWLMLRPKDLKTHKSSPNSTTTSLCVAMPWERKREPYVHARQCIGFNPMHGKAHLRIAMLSSEDDPASLSHLDFAAALLGANHEEVKPMLKAHRQEAEYTLLRTSAEAQSLMTKLKLKLLEEKTSTSKQIFVFAPGRYQLQLSVVQTKTHVRLLGLGDVVIVKGSGNALLVAAGGTAEVENMRIEEGTPNPIGAAFVVREKGTQLRLVKCGFQGLGGITVMEERFAHRQLLRIHEDAKHGSGAEGHGHNRHSNHMLQRLPSMRHCHI